MLWQVEGAICPCWSELSAQAAMTEDLIHMVSTTMTVVNFTSHSVSWCEDDKKHEKFMGHQRTSHIFAFFLGLFD